MSLQEHRIYRYMGEPLRFFGLNMPSIFWMMGSGTGFFLVDTNFWRLVFLGVGAGGILVFKKLEELWSGLSLQVYLYGMLGIDHKLPDYFPPSAIEKWY